MALFSRQPEDDESYTRQFAQTREEEYDDDGDYPEEETWDDGFDELLEEDEEEEEDDPLLEEERRLERQRKFRIAAGFGDLGAAMAGVVVILALVAFLITMLRFLSTDFSQNFSLFQTRF